MAERDRKSTRKKPKRSVSIRQAKMDKFIDTAMSVWMKRGYANTTMEDIAKATKLSKGGLYHYFKSKEEIFKYATERVYVYESQMLETLTLNYPSVKLIDEQIRKWVGCTDEFRRVIRFMYGELRYLPKKTRHKILYEMPTPVLDVFRKTLRKGVEEGVFEDVNTESLTYILYVLGHAWAFGHWYLKRIVTLEEYGKLVARVILRGIKKHKSG